MLKCLGMNYSFVDLKKTVELLKSQITRAFFSNITVINSRDFLVVFSSNHKEKFLISLNHQCPFMSYVDINESVPTIAGSLNDNLRKYIRDAQVMEVKLLNDDRVVEFTLSKSNDFFDKETHYLVLEMIPHRANLIILNDKRVIEFAMHTTTLEVSHPIMKGIVYQPANKADNFINSSDEHSLSEIKDFATNYFLESKNNRLKEKYNVLLKHFKSRLKSLKTKQKVINEEINNATKNLSYMDHGNMLLALANSPEDLKEYLTDNGLTLNEDLTIGQNANYFFKKYKKAKRTIEMDSVELVKANNEIERLTVVLNNVQFMNDDDLLEVAEEYLPHKFKTVVNGKKKKTNISYVEVENTKIYFGKSAKQNNELTFNKAQKDHYFLHIKDYTGSHVIIASNNPSDKVIQTAAEICLILSNKESGEVQYTQVKNIKKGTALGEALLKQYQLIIIKNINKDTIDLIIHSQI